MDNTYITKVICINSRLNEEGVIRRQVTFKLLLFILHLVVQLKSKQN